MGFIKRNKLLVFVVFGLLFAPVAFAVTMSSDYGSFFVVNDNGQMGIASTSAIVVASSTGYIGIGTSSPYRQLSIAAPVGEPGLIALVASSSDQTWEIGVNADTGRLTFFALDGGATTASFKFDPSAVENLLRVGISNANTVDTVGDLYVSSSTRGLILRSPDQTCLLVFATDFGLSSSSVTCP